MVGVQDFFGAGEILLGARLHAPGQGQQPVQIVAADRCFRRHRRHRLQLFQFGIGLVAGLLAELGRSDLFFQLGDLVLTVLAVAQLLLNGLHLLIQIVFALGLLHLRLYAGFDLLFDLQDRHFALHMAIDLFQTLGDVERFQKILPLADFNSQMAADQIGQPRGFARVRHGGHDLFRDVLAHLDVTLEFLGHGADQRGDAVSIARRFRQRLGRCLEIIAVRHKAGDLHAFATLDQNLYGPVGKFQQLQYVGQDANAKDAVLGGFVDGGVLLRGQQDGAIPFHHRFQRPHRFLAPYEQRHDHVRKHHDVAQGQHRMCCGVIVVHVPSFHARSHGPIGRQWPLLRII